MTQSPHRATPEMAMTLEFVTYNGNMDMFTHARVKFELQPTGFLDTTVRLGREMAGSRHAILRFHVSFNAFSRQLRKDTLLLFFLLHAHQCLTSNLMERLVPRSPLSNRLRNQSEMIQLIANRKQRMRTEITLKIFER